MVECEIAEMEFLGRKSSTQALTRVAAIMPQNPLRSKRTSNLGIQQNFISSSLSLHCLSHPDER